MVNNKFLSFAFSQIFGDRFASSSVRFSTWEGGVKDIPDEVVGGRKLAIRYLDCGKKGKKIQPPPVSRGSLYHNNTPLLGNSAPKVLGGEGLEVGRCQENASTSPQGSTKTVKA